MLRKLIGQVFIFFLCIHYNQSVWASDPGSASDERKTIDKTLAAMGEPLFLHYCSHCHGIDGKGDGYNSEFLDKEPADLTDLNFIHKKTNDQIFRVIFKGGSGVKKSHLMPVFGNTLSEEEIWSLVAYIRSLAEDDSHPVNIPRGVMKKARPEPAPVTSAHVESFSRWFLKGNPEEEMIGQGKYLFRKKKSCSACHRVRDEGGKVGPDLSRAGFYYKPEWLFAWIQNPQIMKKRTKMPNIGLSTNEAIEITAFLSSLKGDFAEIPEEWIPYLEKKGNPKRGETLFFDPNGKAYCAQCHWILGKGGKIGANLSIIGSSRTLPFILESILDPSAVITVGYSSLLILTKEGKFLTGIKKGEDASTLMIFTKQGKLMVVPKERIKKFKTQNISMMPGNFKEILTVDEIQDILAYLETLSAPIMKKLRTTTVETAILDKD